MLKNKSIIRLIFLLVITQSSISVADDLPEGVIQAGSLANQKLIHDAMVGVLGEVAGKGCTKAESFVPYIVMMPKGAVGERAWAEKWVVTGCGHEYPIDIHFKESGMNAADWSIE